MNDNVVAIRPRKQAIWQSYAAAGDALQRPCGHCGAPVGQFCTADDGRRLRRVPCVSRCASRDQLMTTTPTGTGKTTATFPSRCTHQIDHNHNAHRRNNP